MVCLSLVAARLCAHNVRSAVCPCSSAVCPYSRTLARWRACASELANQHTLSRVRLSSGFPFPNKKIINKSIRRLSKLCFVWCTVISPLFHFLSSCFPLLPSPHPLFRRSLPSTGHPLFFCACPLLPKYLLSLSTSHLATGFFTSGLFPGALLARTYGLVSAFSFSIFGRPSAPLVRVMWGQGLSGCRLDLWLGTLTLTSIWGLPAGCLDLVAGGTSGAGRSSSR